MRYAFQESFKNMNFSNISISVLVITFVWLVVIVFFVVSKYRNRAEIHLLETERRKNERRENASDGSGSVDGSGEEIAPISDNRREGERRETKDWKSELRAVRSRIENEPEAKDV